MIVLAKVWIQDLQTWFRYAIPFTEETWDRLREVEKDSRGHLLQCAKYDLSLAEALDISITLREFELESFTVMTRGFDVQAWDDQGPSKLICLKKRALVDYQVGGPDKKNVVKPADISKLMEQLFTTTVDDKLDGL